MPWWQDLVSGTPKPIINKGYVTVPDTPGLGVELNDAVVKEHLLAAGLLRAQSDARRQDHFRVQHRRRLAAFR